MKKIIFLLLLAFLVSACATSKPPTRPRRPRAGAEWVPAHRAPGGRWVPGHWR